MYQGGLQLETQGKSSQGISLAFPPILKHKAGCQLKLKALSDSLADWINFCYQLSSASQGTRCIARTHQLIKLRHLRTWGCSSLSKNGNRLVGTMVEPPTWFNLDIEYIVAFGHSTPISGAGFYRSETTVMV